MGVLRSCYTAPARFKVGGPVSSIRYYFAKPDAAVYLKPHVFFPLSQTRQFHPVDGVGELWTGAYPWSGGRLPTGPKGDAVDGTDEDFLGITPWTGPADWRHVPDCRIPIILTLRVRRPLPMHTVALAFSAEGDWQHRRANLDFLARSSYPPYRPAIAFSGDGPLSLVHPPLLQMLATSTPQLDPSRSITIGLLAGSVPGWSHPPPVELAFFTAMDEPSYTGEGSIAFAGESVPGYASVIAGPVAFTAVTDVLDDAPRAGFIAFSGHSSTAMSRAGFVAFGSRTVIPWTGQHAATVVFVADVSDILPKGDPALSFVAEGGDGFDGKREAVIAFDAETVLPDEGAPDPGSGCDDAAVFPIGAEGTFGITGMARHWFKFVPTTGVEYHVKVTMNSGSGVFVDVWKGSSCLSRSLETAYTASGCAAFTMSSSTPFIYVEIGYSFGGTGNYTISIDFGPCP